MGNIYNDTYVGELTEAQVAKLEKAKFKDFFATITYYRRDKIGPQGNPADFSNGEALYILHSHRVNPGELLQEVRQFVDGVRDGIIYVMPALAPGFYAAPIWKQTNGDLKLGTNTFSHYSLVGATNLNFIIVNKIIEQIEDDYTFDPDTGTITRLNGNWFPGDKMITPFTAQGL